LEGSAFVSFQLSAFSEQLKTSLVNVVDFAKNLNRYALSIPRSAQKADG